jgi:hypothetical protein
MRIPSDPAFLIDWAFDLSRHYQFWDFHAHPFCVFSGDTDYQADKNIDGLYSKSNRQYHTPVLEVKANSSGQSDDYKVASLPGSALLLSSRLIYSFTGPRVFLDYIEIVGISRVMLLPVAHSAGIAEDLLESMTNMFSEDVHFHYGCPLPVDVSPKKLQNFLLSAQDKWGIKLIKIHPNLLGIDPISKDGRNLLETTLEIAGRLKLPIIIHGGRTPGILPVENREFGTLSRLSKIDWSISSSPVIIAHAGCYGMEGNEIGETIRILEGMLNLHSNLMVDISSMDFPVLQKLMKSISYQRIIFGSDSLYCSIWTSWINLLRTITTTFKTPDTVLIQIASSNPNHCLLPKT